MNPKHVSLVMKELHHCKQPPCCNGSCEAEKRSQRIFTLQIPSAKLRRITITNRPSHQRPSNVRLTLETPCKSRMDQIASQDAQIMLRGSGLACARLLQVDRMPTLVCGGFGAMKSQGLLAGSWTFCSSAPRKEGRDGDLRNNHCLQMKRTPRGPPVLVCPERDTQAGDGWKAVHARCSGGAYSPYA